MIPYNLIKAVRDQGHRTLDGGAGRQPWVQQRTPVPEMANRVVQPVMPSGTGQNFLELRDAGMTQDEAEAAYPAYIKYAALPKNARLTAARNHLRFEQQSKKDDEFFAQEQQKLKDEASRIAGMEGGLDALERQMLAPAPVPGPVQMSGQEGIAGLVGGMLGGDVGAGVNSAQRIALERAQREYAATLAEFQSGQQSARLNFDQLSGAINRDRALLDRRTDALSGARLDAEAGRAKYQAGVDQAAFDLEANLAEENQKVQGRIEVETTKAKKDLLMLTEMAGQGYIRPEDIGPMLLAKYDGEVARAALNRAQARNLEADNTFQRDKLAWEKDRDTQRLADADLDRSQRERLANARIQATAELIGRNLSAQEQRLLMEMGHDVDMSELKFAQGIVSDEMSNDDAKARKASIEKLRAAGADIKVKLRSVNAQIDSLKMKGRKLTADEEALLPQLELARVSLNTKLSANREMQNEAVKAHQKLSADTPKGVLSSAVEKLRAMGEAFKAKYGSTVEQFSGSNRGQRGGAGNPSKPSKHNDGRALDVHYKTDAERKSKIGDLTKKGSGVTLIIDYAGQRTWRPGRGWRSDPKIDKTYKHLHVEVD